MSEKGQRKNGPCNVTTCQKPGANHWNTSTLAWYCPSCARKINEVVMSTPPLCIHPNNLPPEQARTTQQQPVGDIGRIIRAFNDMPEPVSHPNETWCDDYANAFEALKLAINATPAQGTTADRRQHDRRTRPSLQTNAGNRREKERRK